VHEDGAALDAVNQTRVLVGLVQYFADDDGVRHGQQADHGGVAQELEHLARPRSARRA